MRQQLRQSEENCAQLKIRLNEERARHAETADQSRALTHLAAQLRAKTEKYETVITKQESNAKIFQKVRLKNSINGKISILFIIEIFQ